MTELRSSLALQGYGRTQPLVSPQSKESAGAAIAPGTSNFRDVYATTLSNPVAAPEDAPQNPRSFTQTMKSMAQTAISTLKKSEEVSVAGIEGKADAQAVVQAMANAEMTLRTALSIRDKVVEAYQEILRMPI